MTDAIQRLVLRRARPAFFGGAVLGFNERIQRVDTLQVSGGGAGIDGAYDDFEYDGQTRSR